MLFYNGERGRTCRGQKKQSQFHTLLPGPPTTEVSFHLFFSLGFCAKSHYIKCS